MRARGLRTKSFPPAVFLHALSAHATPVARTRHAREMSYAEYMRHVCGNVRCDMAGRPLHSTSVPERERA